MSQDRKSEIAELRRRLEELEAQERAQSAGAPPPTPSGIVAASKQDRTPLYGAAALVVILLGTMAYCSSQSAPEPGPDADPGPTAIQQEIAASVAATPMKPVEPANLTQWSYRDSVDPMSDRMTRFACVTSQNEVRLYPPYSDVKAELCIRQSPRYGLDAYVQLLGDGQIICRSYDSCTVKVRFGEGAQQSFSATDAADGSSDIIFITNASRFVTGAKAADVTRVQMTLYQAGDQVVEFNTKGLEWPRPADGGSGRDE